MKFRILIDFPMILPNNPATAATANKATKAESYNLEK